MREVRTCVGIARDVDRDSPFLRWSPVRLVLQVPVGVVAGLVVWALDRRPPAS